MGFESSNYLKQKFLTLEFINNLDLIMFVFFSPLKNSANIQLIIHNSKESQRPFVLHDRISNIWNSRHYFTGVWDLFTNVFCYPQWISPRIIPPLFPFSIRVIFQSSQAEYPVFTLNLTMETFLLFCEVFSSLKRNETFNSRPRNCIIQTSRWNWKKIFE